MLAATAWNPWVSADFRPSDRHGPSLTDEAGMTTTGRRPLSEVPVSIRCSAGGDMVPGVVSEGAEAVVSVVAAAAVVVSVEAVSVEVASVEVASAEEVVVVVSEAEMEAATGAGVADSAAVSHEVEDLAAEGGHSKWLRSLFLCVALVFFLS
jgi:hypothetical protein